mgnify:CR=1 FL=1
MKNVSVWFNIAILLILLKFLWNFNIPIWVIILFFCMPILIKLILITGIITMLGIWLKKK